MVTVRLSACIVYCLIFCGQANAMFNRAIRQKLIRQQASRQLGTQVQLRRMHRIIIGGTIAVGIAATKKCLDDLQEIKMDLEECHEHLKDNNEEIISLCHNVCFRNAVAIGDLTVVQSYLDTPEIMLSIDDQVLFEATIYARRNNPELFRMLQEDPRVKKFVESQEFNMILAEIIAVIS